MTAYFQLPIIVLFWRDLGLDMTKIMTLQAIFSIATVILEVPSGIFADMYGRKVALVLASLANVIGIALYCVAGDFYDLLIAELFLAAFVALQSGADSAFLYDNLKAMNREAEYTRIFGNLVFVSTLVIGGANVFGGFIGAYDLRATFYVCLVFVTLAFLVSLTLREPNVRDEATERITLSSQLGVIGDTLKMDRTLLLLILYAGLVLVINQAGLWMYQPYFELSGIDVIWFGVIFASFQLVAALAGKYYYLAEKRFPESALLIFLLVASCLSTILMGAMVTLFSFTLIYFHQVVRGFYKVVFSGIINRRVASEVRASILSVQNLFGRVLTAMLMPFVGWFADVYTITDAFILIGVIGLGAGIPVFWALKRIGIL